MQSHGSLANYCHRVLLPSSSSLLLFCRRWWRQLLVLFLLNLPSLVHGFSPLLNTNNKANSKNNDFKNIHLLILPGFGNESNDYICPPLPQSVSSAATTLQESASLVKSLQKRSWNFPSNVHVLPVRRIDWLQVFLFGIWDLDFWLGRAPPTRPAFSWYLQRIVNQVNAICNDNDEDKTRVVLICHSAGGWLARAALGFYGKESTAPFEQQKDDGCTLDLHRIAGMVTLGSPHLPPPPFTIVAENDENAQNKKKKLMDMTRGALRITNEQFPGAYFKDLFYITVIGNAIQGIKPDDNNNAMDETSKTSSGTSRRNVFAYNSYEVVCGNGSAVGDGVVPVPAAHLQDATQLTLPDVWHSIDVPDKWYGSDSVVDEWHDAMIQELVKQQQQRTEPESNKKGGFPTILKNIFES